MARLISPENMIKKARAVQLYEAGWTQNAIAEKLDANRNAVKVWLKGVNDNNGNSRGGQSPDCRYYTLDELQRLFNIDPKTLRELRSGQEVRRRNGRIVITADDAEVMKNLLRKRVRIEGRAPKVGRPTVDPRVREAMREYERAQKNARHIKYPGYT